MSEKLIWVLDTRDSLVSFICRECIEKHRGTRVGKDLLVDHMNQVTGNCPDSLHEE